MSIPDFVRYRLDPGEDCPAVVTKRYPDGRADLRVILSADQAVRYAREDWWTPAYLFAVQNIPPECACEQGGEPGEFYVPEAAPARPAAEESRA